MELKFLEFDKFRLEGSITVRTVALEQPALSIMTLREVDGEEVRGGAFLEIHNSNSRILRKLVNSVENLTE